MFWSRAGEVMAVRSNVAGTVLFVIPGMAGGICGFCRKVSPLPPVGQMGAPLCNSGAESNIVKTLLINGLVF